ncbi:tetratricopeptide repeat protein [Actinoplanes sp. KI2]|uniref:tetratricopeptide repeat protein n=1 Tax=Actinoplanes sp. KI2 TaxID=2983315 RepID=UPI0021D57A0B|nr:tetratricopeptide repeat protein [Actinoplanes sp. KI2]MCU7729050.1 tetratricopeptide repeat protein [Actinoplanes sp. KI2]
MSAAPAFMSPLDQALTLLAEGRVADAEERMKQALRQATELHGEHTAGWAAAQSDMGNVLLRADQPAWAAECFRAAVSVPVPPGADPQRRLGYQLNLGIALALCGRLEEGAEALRESRAGRAAFFGRKHVGYATGLEPLADVLLRLGDHAGALEAIDEAVWIFKRAGHERAASSVALRGVIMVANGHTGPLFPALKDLPDPLVERVGTFVAARIQRDIDPAAAYRMIGQLAGALADRLGPDHPATIEALRSLATEAADRGQHAHRIAALEQILASYDRQDRAEDGLAAATDVAEALSDARETDKCLLAYEEVADRARRTGRVDRLSQALFDWGLALRNAGRPEDAVERFGEAVVAARGGDDRELRGQVIAAYGIALQHLGRAAEAREALEEGLSVLDPTDAAAQPARGHLVALLDGRDCGCTALQAAVEEAFREFVVSRVPADLLARFGVRVVGNNFVVDVEFQREPGDEELAKFNEVVRAAHAEFSRQIAG